MNSKSLITLVVIIAVVFAGFILYKNQANKVTNNTANQNAQIVKPTMAPEVSVTLTKNGFEPKELKIKAKTRVVWINNSGNSASVNSDNHPTHLLYPFLNLGEFSNSSSIQAFVGQPGTYTYHNHLNPDQKGTIVAQ